MLDNWDAGDRQSSYPKADFFCNTFSRLSADMKELIFEQQESLRLSGFILKKNKIFGKELANVGLRMEEKRTG